DVLPLATFLLCFFARQGGKHLAGFSPDAEAALSKYAWPGNVRELRNAVERGVILARWSTVELEHLPGQLVGVATARIEVGGHVTLEELEDDHIRRVVGSTASLDEAARVLGIDPSTLYRKRKRSTDRSDG